MKHNVTISALNLVLILLLTFFVGAFVGAATRPPSMTRADITAAMRGAMQDTPEERERAKHFFDLPPATPPAGAPRR